jgi:beta-phosphoglucomutase-like phosphatase (HAD superfamily)
MGSPRLREVLGRIDSALALGRLPLVVFDLDSTLFSTAPRNLRILHEFAAAEAHTRPEIVEITRAIGLDEMGWNIHESLARRGVDDEELLEALRGFWHERFFTDDYCFTDTPVDGAPAYVTACHQRGALIYYLSGRHVGGMELGTVRALREHDFPYWTGRCIVHLKPSFDMADRAFKDEALADIRSYQGEVVATFENEPGNANLFAEAFPDALHFLLETVTSPEPETPRPELIRSADFVLP